MGKIERLCRICDGRGTICDEICTSCKGTGQAKEPEKPVYKSGLPEDFCPECRVSGGHEEGCSERPKPSPTSLSLEDVIEENMQGTIKSQSEAIKRFIRGEIEQCLTENDSDTHIIAKDLIEMIDK